MIILVYLTSCPIHFFHFKEQNCTLLIFCLCLCFSANIKARFFQIFLEIFFSYDFLDITTYIPSTSLLSYGSPKSDELRLLPPMLYSLLLLPNVHVISIFSVNNMKWKQPDLRHKLACNVPRSRSVSNLSIFSLFFLFMEHKRCFLGTGAHYNKNPCF